MLLTKDVRTQIKALGKAEGDGGAVGQFEAIVSVFDNIDSYGDVVRKGAFAKSLADWEASGDPIPIYYSHRLDDPDMNIGHVLSATETDAGLHIVGQLDLEMQKAAQVYRLLDGRRLTQFSFSYAVPPGGSEVKTDPDTNAEYNELTEIDLFEVGPTPVGANPDTQLLAVKDARFVARDLARQMRKSGRKLSDATISALQNASDELGSAKEAIDALIAEAQASADSNQASNGTGTGKAEDPRRGKAEDPNRRALSVSGESIPLTPSDALTALALLGIRSISHDTFDHSRTA